MAVPANDFPWSWKFNESYQGGPKIDLLPCAIRGGFAAGFRKIIGHSVKSGSLGVTDPWFSEESAYNTSKLASR